MIGVKMFGKENLLIVCALERETQGQLDGCFEDIFNDRRNILYTGVGKINATIKLTQRLHKSYLDYSPGMPELVINYGTAGSKELSIGELVDCKKFVQRDMNVMGLGFMRGQTPFENNMPIILDSTHVEFNPIGKHYVCGSGDNFVENIANELDYIVLPRSV